MFAERLNYGSLLGNPKRLVRCSKHAAINPNRIPERPRHPRKGDVTPRLAKPRRRSINGEDMFLFFG